MTDNSAETELPLADRLQKVVNVMKAARKSRDHMMNVWSTDLEAVEEALATIKPVATVSRDREAIARIIDLDAFSGLQSERAWAAQYNKPDSFWAPWQKRCDEVLAKADAILSLTPRGSGAEPFGWVHRHSSSRDWTFSVDEPTGPSIHLFEVKPLYSLSPVLVQLVQTRCVQPELSGNDGSEAKSELSLPLGWQLVPDEITLDMQKAYFDEVDRNMTRVQNDCTFGRFANNRVAYKKMLQAAPKLPAAPASLTEGDKA